MLYNLFNFQSNDNWDTDGLYWYNEFYTKKPVWTSLNQFHGLQKTSRRWSSSVPTISGSVLDWLQFTVACFGGKKLDWTGLANTSHQKMATWGSKARGFHWSIPRPQVPWPCTNFSLSGSGTISGNWLLIRPNPYKYMLRSHWYDVFLSFLLPHYLPVLLPCISSFTNSFFPLAQVKKAAKRDKSGRSKKPHG